MDTNQIQDKIIDAFDDIPDNDNKYSYFRRLVNFTKNFTGISTGENVRSTTLRGFKSNITIESTYKNGKVYFQAHSNNLLAKGIVNLILKVYSGSTPAAITNTDLYFLNEIKLFKYLNENALSDLLSILKNIKSIAIDYQVKFFNRDAKQDS